MLSGIVTTYAQTANGYYKGDLNKDGKVTIVDVALMVDVLKSGSESAKTAPCYVNDDKIVDLDDLALLVEIVLGKKEMQWVSTNPSIPIGTDPINPEDAEAKPTVPADLE